MQNPTPAMRAEAASAGSYRSPWRKEPFPRIQILSIPELPKAAGSNSRRQGM